jgi:predicted nuclease with RNAse H fold
MSLRQIEDFCEEEDVLGVAIDAQLSIALDDESGLRSSDLQLRGSRKLRLEGMLPSAIRGSVLSFNYTSALTVRGRLLAEALGPLIGTILETHPLAALYLALGEESLPSIRAYKTKPEPGMSLHDKAALHQRRTAALGYLANAWSELFHIDLSATPVTTDGALDAIVCATVVYLYHRRPNSLKHLRHTSRRRIGRGPFYVPAPGATFDNYFPASIPP